MEDYRLMQIEDLEDEDEDEDEDEEDDEEHEEDLTPVGITPPRDLGFILDAGEEEYDDEEEDDDEEDEDEEDYEEGEEEEELIPLARVLSAGSVEDGDYEDEDEDEDDEDYEDDEEEDDEDEDYEEEEVEELIPVEMMSPRVSSSISHGTTLQGPVLINEGLLDDSESREGKPPGNQSNGGKEELNIEGFFCPICFEAWTSGGEHQICCLPCGHLYGLSCIKKWLHQRRSSVKCPLCNNLCTLKDVTVIYGSPVCIADEEFQKARIDDVIERSGPESVNTEIFTQAAGTARRGLVRGLGGSNRVDRGIDTISPNMAFYGATQDDHLHDEIEQLKQDMEAEFQAWKAELEARFQAYKAAVDARQDEHEAYIRSQLEPMWHAIQSLQQQNQARSSSMSSTPPGSATLPPFMFSLQPPSFRYLRQSSTPVQPPPYPPPRASQYPPAPPPYYPQYPPAPPQ